MELEFRSDLTVAEIWDAFEFRTYLTARKISLAHLGKEHQSIQEKTSRSYRAEPTYKKNKSTKIAYG